ncbi:hypothetical protein GAO09_19360 [Rhizobiales bacterium RZME27]|uniref:Uncharacterized protein n=1 Tax=Endobacterium cereale TaxID=2663029 RepID=A0A6A8AEH0_9HYPH|nr:hypothetical protein [Endobacterium cereale]MQY48197.1 hypothetical protein [Endobacterium cereale]
MGEQLAKLEAYVAHTAFERGASFAAVLIGNKFKIGHRSDVEHRSDCLLLLPLVCDTGLHSLKGRNIGLAQFEVAGGLALYDLDREPWKVFAVSHQRRSLADTTGPVRHGIDILRRQALNGHHCAPRQQGAEILASEPAPLLLRAYHQGFRRAQCGLSIHHTRQLSPLKTSPPTTNS